MERLPDFTKRVTSLPRGTALTRLAIAMLRTGGDLPDAARIARRWNDTPQVATILNAMAIAGTSNLKAAVAAGDATTSGWASQLVYLQDAEREFVELLRPATIIGRLTGLRRTPSNVRFVAQGAGASVGWLGSGVPAPAGAMALSTQQIGIAKIGGLIVLTRELVELGSADAEAMIRSELVAAVSQFVDQQFISPGVAAVLNVSPASITNGLTPVTSSGTSVAQITADFRALFDKLLTAGIKLLAPALVMTPATALALAMKRTAADLPAFPGITALGGNWCGVPVITSANVPSTVSGGSIIVLADSAEILNVEDGLTLDAGEHASVQMLDNPITGAASLVSLFQNNLSGLRITAHRNWKVRRPGAVAYIDGIFI